MKRKLLYAIIFISIFLMSTTRMVTPVQGYENPDIPAEAKGMLLDDAEITAYDEDEMEDHLGAGFDIKDIKDGDPDIVGARSQMKILDWESDEDLIDYEDDFLYAAVDVETNWDTIRLTLWELANATTLIPDDQLPPIINLIAGITYQALISFGATYLPIIGEAVGANTTATTSVRAWDILMSLFADSYDGTILEREIWDYLDPAEEFDNSDPDTDDDEVPYVLDPRDWLAWYYNGMGLKNDVLTICDSIQADLNSWYFQLAADAIANATVHGAMSMFLPSALLDVLNATSINYLPPGNPGPNYPLGAYLLASNIIQTIWYQTEFGFPDKFGLLMMLLEAGQPTVAPNDDFIAKVLDEYDIKDDVLYRMPFIQYGEDWLGAFGAAGADGDVSAIPYGTIYMAGGAYPIPMGGETIYVYSEVDVSLDAAGNVEVEFNYQDGQIDPKDLIENIITPGSEDDPKELEDWEWIFPVASDGPNQMRDGDTIFWESTPMEGPIPGYEIHIVVGASLITVIGLVYVVMRKRKR